MKEDYVNFEVAKLLKEKGFNENCFALYNPSEELIQCGVRLNNTQVGRVEGSYSAPTLQMAMKWLREKEYAINIDCMDKCFTYKYYIKHINNIDKHTDFKHYNTYEEAVEAAIEYCLENLI